MYRNAESKKNVSQDLTSKQYFVAVQSARFTVFDRHRCFPPSLFPTKVRTCRFQDTVTLVLIASPGRCLLIRKTRVTPLKKSRSLFQRLGIKSPVVR